jgi:hypothetical protein
MHNTSSGARGSSSILEKAEAGESESLSCNRAFLWSDYDLSVRHGPGRPPKDKICQTCSKGFGDGPLCDGCDVFNHFECLALDVRERLESDPSSEYYCLACLASNEALLSCTVCFLVFLVLLS